MLDVAALFQFDRPFGLADNLSDTATARNIKPLKGSVDLTRQAEQNGDLPPGCQMECMDDIAVERVGHHQHQAIGTLVHGQGTGFLEKPG